jgi:hypothetical protein
MTRSRSIGSYPPSRSASSRFISESAMSEFDRGLKGEWYGKGLTLSQLCNEDLLPCDPPVFRNERERLSNTS